MRRPPLPVMLMGHKLTALPIWAGIFVTGYRTWIGVQDATGLIVFVALGVLCGKASQRREAYLGWKRDWEAMNGTTPRQRYEANFLRNVVAVLAWLLGAFIASALMYNDHDRWIAILFWLGSFVFFARRVAIWHRSRQPPARSGKQTPVTVCLRRPVSAPSVEQAYAQLPAYCRELLLRR